MGDNETTLEKKPEATTVAIEAGHIRDLTGYLTEHCLHSKDAENSIFPPDIPVFTNRIGDEHSFILIDSNGDFLSITDRGTDFVKGDKKATDMEVLIYGPQLLTNLYGNVVDEIPQLITTESVQDAIHFLQSATDIGDAVLDAQRRAIAIGTPEISDIKEVTFQDLIDNETKDKAELYTHVWSVYRNRPQIFQELKKLCDEYAIEQINQKVKELVTTAGSAIFPTENTFDLDGDTCYPTAECSDGYGLDDLYYWWVVSKTGKLLLAVERCGNGVRTRNLNPNTLINNAPRVIDQFIGDVIDDAVARVFLSLEVEKGEAI